MDEISLTDVKDFFSFLLKKFWIVLLITFAIFLGGTFYSTYIKVPMYRSTTSIILATNNDASQGSTITTTDISINQNLVNTYAEIIKSRKVLNATISELNLNISYSDLAGSVSVDSKDGTEIITVSVVNKDKVLAKTIADSVANNFKEEVAKLYNMKNVSILDKAEVTSRPYNLNAKKEITIYIVGGLALGIIILFLWFYFDKTIKNSEEVERETSVLKEQAMNEGKPAEIAEKMVNGRINKFYKEICLEEQDFVKDSDMTVGAFVKSKNGSIVNMVRFEVGEGIEKKEENFAEEVMNQIKG